MALERGQPVRAIVLHKRIRDELYKFGTMRDARSIRAETRVGREFGPFEDVAREYAELQTIIQCKYDGVYVTVMLYGPASRSRRQS